MKHILARYEFWSRLRLLKEVYNYQVWYTSISFGNIASTSLLFLAIFRTLWQFFFSWARKKEMWRSLTRFSKKYWKLHELFPFCVKILYKGFLYPPICCNLYSYNKKYVYECEKPFSCRAAKFHMKNVGYLNTCTWDLDFRMFSLASILLIRNNNFIQPFKGLLYILIRIRSVKYTSIEYVIGTESEMNGRCLRHKI